MTAAAVATTAAATGEESVSMTRGPPAASGAIAPEPAATRAVAAEEITAAAGASTPLYAIGMARPFVTSSLVHALLSRALARCLRHYGAPRLMTCACAAREYPPAAQRGSGAAGAALTAAHSRAAGGASATATSSALPASFPLTAIPACISYVSAVHEAAGGGTVVVSSETRDSLSMGHVCLVAAVHAAMLNTGFSLRPRPPPFPSPSPNPTPAHSSLATPFCIVRSKPHSAFSTSLRPFLIPCRDNPGSLWCSYVLNPSALNARLPPDHPTGCLVSLHFLPLGARLAVYGSVSLLAQNNSRTTPHDSEPLTSPLLPPRRTSTDTDAHTLQTPFTWFDSSPSTSPPPSFHEPIRVSVPILSHVNSVALARVLSQTAATRDPSLSPSSYLPTALVLLTQALPLWCLLKDSLVLPLLYECARAVSCTCTVSPLPHMHLPLSRGGSTGRGDSSRVGELGAGVAATSEADAAAAGVKAGAGADETAARSASGGLASGVYKAASVAQPCALVTPRASLPSPSLVLLPMPLLLALPNEVSTKVMRKVPAPSLALLACVSRHLRGRVAQADDVWHAKYSWYSEHVWPTDYKTTHDVREDDAEIGGEGVGFRSRRVEGDGAAAGGAQREACTTAGGSSRTVGVEGGDTGRGNGRRSMRSENGSSGRKNQGGVEPAAVPPPPRGFTSWMSAFACRWKERRAEVEKEEVRRQRLQERERERKRVQHILMEAYASRYAASSLPLHGPPEPLVWPDPRLWPTYF